VVGEPAPPVRRTRPASGYIERERLREAASQVKVYIDTADWWIGLYRGPHHYYLCPLPCVVIRWDRYRVSRLDEALAAAIERGIKHDDAMERRERY
jgi:hypothetical protein